MRIEIVDPATDHQLDIQHDSGKKKQKKKARKRGARRQLSNGSEGYSLALWLLIHMYPREVFLLHMLLYILMHNQLAENMWRDLSMVFLL